MDLSKTKLYQVICDPQMTGQEIWAACKEYIAARKNLNVVDRATGHTFLHVLAGAGGNVLTPQGVSAVYLMGSSGLNVDARDNQGDTCLHVASRTPGSFRVVEALLRLTCYAY